jgi:hypothetical protein
MPARTPAKPFTYEGGRTIYHNGKPFISIQRDGETAPVVADATARLIVALLNRSAKAKQIAKDRRAAVDY